MNCVVTSPPYWGLRDYGVSSQIGREKTPQEYVVHLVEIFHEVKRILRRDGTAWLNLGDTYAGGGQNSGSTVDELTEKQRSNAGCRYERNTVPPGLKAKDLVGVPWRVALALQANGWWLRSDIIWAKPNPMPESVLDRPTRSHEHLFLLAKNKSYYYDSAAIAEPLLRPDEGGRVTPAKFGGADKHVESGKQSRLHSGNEYLGTKSGTKNKRDVWNVAPQPFRGAHFAVFPERLIEPCVLAGCPVGGITVDPFCGSGTVGVVCARHDREFIGIEIKPEYVIMARERISKAMRELENV